MTYFWKRVDMKTKVILPDAYVATDSKSEVIFLLSTTILILLPFENFTFLQTTNFESHVTQNYFLGQIKN